jgi:hypothetical protein
LRRAIWALSAVGFCEIVGTIGFRLLENFSWIDAFYEESMLATGQGPAITLVHDSSKVFASVMGFISVGSTLTTLVFTLGPAIARFWHEARLTVERDFHRLEAEFSHGAGERRHEGAPPRPEPPGPREPPGGSP